MQMVKELQREVLRPREHPFAIPSWKIGSVRTFVRDHHERIRELHEDSPVLLVPDKDRVVAGIEYKEGYMNVFQSREQFIFLEKDLLILLISK
jgi:hypothetical protein